LPQCEFSYVGIAGKTTACNLALSRSDMLDHTPTSHSFTDVSWNKLLLRFISYVKHSLYKHNTFSKAGVSCTHLKCCYFAVSLHSFRSLSATQHQLNAYQLHRTSYEGHKVLVKYEQILQLTHITWLPLFSEFPLIILLIIIIIIVIIIIIIIIIIK
jgi:hypothetical protein